MSRRTASLFYLLAPLYSYQVSRSRRVDYVFTTILFGVLTLQSYGQTLYVPGGTGGIGTSSTSYVGVGTNAPKSALDVNGNVQISNAAIPMGLMTEVGGSSPLLDMSVNFREPNKNIAYIGAGFRIDTRGGAYPLYQWILRPANGDVPNEKMLMSLGQNGNLGVGTSSPDQKLTVNGIVHATEVRVDLSVPGPDYVFEKNYSLPSLEQIEKYIDAHKHLPEVPSAKEMEGGGINIGEMNMLLLKKVEELTLYVIEENKSKQEMKLIIDGLQNQIEQLKKEIKNK